ncbi:hypothetical protein CQ007_10340 [Pseudomonas sp. MYb185]|nr:hypothetical protein CQ007_10340 [Pseudomonas sp. MYb185]
MYTLYAIGIFFGLLILSFTLAGISYHIKAISPIWYVSYMLNKFSAVAIPVCMVIDIFNLIF